MCSSDDVSLRSKDELDAALKAAVAKEDGLLKLTPKEIREIVGKKRAALAAAQDVVDAEGALVAAESSATQAKGDAQKQQSFTTTIVIVMVLVVAVVLVGAVLYVRKAKQAAGNGTAVASSSTYEAGGGGHLDGSVVAFENPMYTQGDQQQHQNTGNTDGAGAGFYQDVVPAVQQHAGTGYMDVAPTRPAQAAYVEVSATVDANNDWESEDEEV